jgi:hypothetical protein
MGLNVQELSLEQGKTIGVWNRDGSWSNSNGAGLEILNALKLERDNIAKSIIVINSDISRTNAELNATREKYQNCVNQSSTARQKGCCAEIWIDGKISPCVGALYQIRPLPTKYATFLANKLNKDLRPRLELLKSDLVKKQKQIEDTEALYNTGTGTDSTNPAVNATVGSVTGGLGNIISGGKKMSPTVKYGLIGLAGLTALFIGYKVISK